MGSPNLISGKSTVKQHSPLTAMKNFSATCEVTNRIDIDKYFEVLKKECAKLDPPKSPRRVLGRSVSSSKIETGSLLPSPRSTGRKTRNHNLKKRLSCDERKLHHMALESQKSPTLRKSGYFNYDLSGQIIEGSNHDADHCIISRQKSWDLSLSKLKRLEHEEHYDKNSADDLTASYSEGDFKDFMNNNKIIHSKSFDCISDLGERHREHAMIHGKIYSVSEQNRRSRRRYYKKDRKNSDERNQSGMRKCEEQGLSEAMQQKLNLHERDQD